MKKLLTLLAMFVGSSATAQHLPTLSYMHPDAAAPGMAIYTELLGPNQAGNFGQDGLNQASIELVNPADAVRIIVGPRVTSWGGRMVSVFLIVVPGAASGPVPYRVSTLGGKSNVDTFYIVQAQHMDANLAPGALGSGGAYGTRSRRNTLVVDALHLGTGTYTVSDLDPDPSTPGNQAYLPLTILSQGDVSVEGTLSVDGQGKNAIAGGGGGGGCYTVGSIEPLRNIGGDGFTAGGGMHGVGGLGSGADPIGWNGGSSLNGAPGGGGLGDRWFDDQGGGGGTAFQFGTASQGGTWYAEGGNSPAGGVGGGSGGGEKSDPDSSFGGGGGAFASDGGSSGGGALNGGKAYGNCLIIPFCGGSGGGGGNQFGDGYAGVGGAGGGAIHILSMGKINISGTISANGAAGEGTHNIFKGGGGGGGAGGAIALTAPLIDIDGYLSVNGGKGGDAVLQPVRGGLFGGDGGNGRIRVIGFIDHSAQDLTAFAGPSAAKLSYTDGHPTITGTGKVGDSVIVFTESAGRWNYDSPLSTQVQQDGKWQVSAMRTPGGFSHVSVLEQLQNPESSPFVLEPMWVISTEDVTLDQSASAVEVQCTPTSVSISKAYTSFGSLQIYFEGRSGMVASAQLFDILGRVVSSALVPLDDQGRGTWSTMTSKLPNGSYIAVVSDGSSSASRIVVIAH